MRWIDEGFQKSPGHYILQTFMAFLVVALLVTVLGVLTHGVIIAALGASTFIVFAMPTRDTARPRSLIGGHAVCMSLGLLCSLPLRMGWVTSGVSVGLLGALACSEHWPSVSLCSPWLCSTWSTRPPPATRLRSPSLP